MLFKIILFLFLLGCFNFLPLDLGLKVMIFVVVGIVYVVIDFYILKRIKFHKILTIGILLSLSLAVIFFTVQILSFLPSNDVMQNDEKYLIVIASLFIAFYLSFQVGNSSSYFSKVKASDIKEGAKHLIDTSAIIDGRLLEIAKSGFIPKSLAIPNFVIRELQLISDSSNNEKRMKGRRGLELLKQMKNSDFLSIQIINEDVKSAKNVDSKLLALAAEKNYKIITTDFNLFKVAQVEGVEALNINYLASLIKPSLNINDRIRVFVVKKGNNKGQGVAFLPDDTLVIIDGAAKYIGTQKQVIITSYVQSESGKMVFARALED